MNTNTNTNTQGDLWSFSEVAKILMQSINQLSKCRTKMDQLSVIASMLENACK